MYQQESSSFRRFFQYVEDSGLRTYDGLVIQNASDIARESDRVRNQTNWTYLQEKHQKKRRQDDAIKRIGEDVSMVPDVSYSGKHFRIGFMTMPVPQDRLPPPSQGFTVRSQSLHSVGGGEDESSQSRKQPPPKPKRDPNTKLSSSSEMVNGGSGLRRDQQETKDTADHMDAQCPFYSEDYRKLPPPKPKRNPNTQLSTSFDESYIHDHASKKSSLRLDKSSSQSQSPGSRDMDDEEPVYIEMVGNILREMKGQEVLEDEQNESVYEEMKYPVLDDLLQDAHSAIMDSEIWSRGTLCDIPPPFPNLLTHRPPLLVFPPAPAQCSPNSDESPLTPMDVTRLPMMENVSYSKSGVVEHPQHHSHRRKDRDRDRDRNREVDREHSSNHTITSSGRSSAPPLPSNYYKSSDSAHGGHGYPRSHSACPSPVSMSRPLTPLSLKRPPPYDTLAAGGSMPRSSSSSSHKVVEPKLSNSSNVHSSMQNVSVRSQTPTSPLDELNNLFTSGKQAVRRESGGRKSREGEVGYRSLPRHDSRDREGRSSPGSSRRGRSSVSPTMMLCGGGGESVSVGKLGRSASTSGVSSPGGTPHRHLHEAHQHALSQMPWLCGDPTMMEMIEKKRVLCREIKARQRPEKNLCKQDSMPILPSWKKKHPPPYSAPASAGATGHNTTVFWDTSI